MGKKGNLLYNGDFETGTTEGWENNMYGMGGDLELSVTQEQKYYGDYAGKLVATKDYAYSYIGYDAVCSFEENEAFLFILPVKLQNNFHASGMLYGLDDKLNLLKYFALGWVMPSTCWRTVKGILRGFGEVTHFKVGCYVLLENEGDVAYIDEAKLIPLRSVRGHELAEFRKFNNISSSFTWYSVLFCIGNCKVRSIVNVRSVEGTNPALNIKLTIGLLDDVNTYYMLEHTEFNDVGIEEKTIDVAEVGYIKIDYLVEGTSPLFNVNHHIRIEPK